MAEQAMRININIIIAILCILAIGLTTYAYDFLSSTPRAGKVTKTQSQENVFKPAPDVTFKSLNGTDIQLHDYRDKIVLLNFWATWCAPCVTEFPQMIELAASRDDIVFLAVSVDSTAKPIERFLSTQNQEFLKSESVVLIHDPDKEITQNIFQILKFPETIIIDENGMMKDKIIGAVDWLSSDIIERIRR